MADTVLPVVLNIGLDTVTPALMAKEGTMIECINYELTDAVGYRRIDGFEAYDGFPNGDVAEYHRLQIIAVTSGEQALLVPGTVIYRSDFGNDPVAIGTILGGPFDTNYYDITPLRSADSFILTEEFLLQADGETFIQLQSGSGILRILGEGSTLGSTFTGFTPDNQAVDVTMPGTLVPGGTLVTAQEYLDNLRLYSQSLRETVNAAPAPVAGLYWFHDVLMAAVNTLQITITYPETDPDPEVGSRFRWNDLVYRAVDVRTEVEGTDTVATLYLSPVGTADTVDDHLVEVNLDNTVVKTWQLDVSTNGNPNYDNSEVAVLGYFPNYSSGTLRGFQYLPSALTVDYTLGDYTATFGPPVTFDENGQYYIANVDGTVMKARLANVVQTSGSWSDGSSAGRAQFVITEVISGNRDYIIDGDEVHSVYPATVDSRIMTVTAGRGLPSYVAGTGALDRKGTRYQWVSSNFYGRTEGYAAYGATGASSAFWANLNGFGSITTGIDEELDTPKYIAFHAGKLALGYGRGSVILSVIGEPANYNGTDGALEFATGDSITGLLEMPGETLAVFGLRSIRKISGTDDTNTKLGTISGSSGCFDYTAVLMGQEALFTGINGISTLQQTAAYGDFSGVRMSDSIANWLRPKLISEFESLQKGGTALAYPVRNKNQYRLVLSSGETVVLTITQEGPKITLLNYGLTGETKLPYAWSSNTDTNGRERIHVSWTERLRSPNIYELENGWGFNGKTFRHSFDLTYLFNSNGSTFSGIEKIRLFGKGYGVATLNVKSSGIEDDFQQPYHNRIQDISIPRVVSNIYNQMQPATNIVDQANWGLGIKLRFENTQNEGTNQTEPSHICQALVLHVRTNGALDG